MDYVGEPIDRIMDANGRGITPKGSSDNRGDKINANGFRQPKGICHSELVATGHVIHSGRLCGECDYSIGQPARSAGGGHQPAQTAFAF
jgi:hypothetical protein